ncbi:hypothetical protein PAXRUDRAFT_37702, partial [Paxillus rubicundulus Ve08.2h10]
MSMEEKLTIFLCMCMTGLSSCHIAKRFQYSPDIITKYYAPYILDMNSFYSSQVKFPSSATPISDHIICDPQFQFFDQCVGTVDDTHIHMFVSAEQQFHMCN